MLLLFKVRNFIIRRIFQNSLYPQKFIIPAKF